MIGGLAELASLPGVPSETTLRQLIRENDDFPVIEHGKNGVGYKIDFTLALGWLKARRDKEQEAARERANQIRQFGLELGLDAGEHAVQAGLSIAERKHLLEEELVAIKIAKQRGELVRKDEVDAAFADVLLVLAERQSSFTARLAKKVDLPRDVQIAIDRQIDSDRAELARLMEQMGSDGLANGDGDEDDNVDPAPALDDPAL